MNLGACILQKLGEQYFLMDFSKESTDNSSMIGITLEKNGDFSAAHYKDDEECNPDDDDIIEYVQDAVYEFKQALKNKNEATVKQATKLVI